MTRRRWSSLAAVLYVWAVVYVLLRTWVRFDSELALAAAVVWLLTAPILIYSAIESETL